MRVLVCAATGTEAKACASGIEKAGLATEFEVLRTGVGLAHASQALAKRLASGLRPKLVVSAGFAGSLDEALPVGAWVVASRVMLLDPQAPKSTRAIAVSNLKAALPEAVTCSLVSAADLTHQNKFNREVFHQIPGPLAVDMESAALAEASEERGIAFMALRMITDSPAEPLPEFVGPFAAAMAKTDTVSRIGLGLRGLKGVLGDPGGVLHMVKNGSKWAMELEKRWASYAHLIRRNVD